eukprot:CAMPEP_0177630796 /NCGR_PEP_ID=MMETSP0447-20121125/1401_1 /TAXON_ID=0 /ORGANISM="Stygamoeba regulata, Strain BSH-02190019" /LENGTH=575 /DNA_ID=CAMNT_0019132225 /DNA_START=99 /DNA_END=1826 /DNA_ORIENTATION=+
MIDVDVNVFFQEEATIGHKIKTSEQIVKAVVSMRCPHPLQSHQLQGLEYSKIFPVVQWLVSVVLEVRAEMGDLVRNYSEFQYSKFMRNQAAAFSGLSEDSIAYIGDVNESYRLKRLYRNAGKLSNLEEQVDAVLLEYGKKPPSALESVSALCSFTTLPSSLSRLKSKRGTLNLSAHDKTTRLIAALAGKSPDAQEEEMKEEMKREEMEHAARLDSLMTNFTDMSEVAGLKLTGAKVGQIVGLHSEEIHKAVTAYDTQMNELSGAHGAIQKSLGEESHRRIVDSRSRQVASFKEKAEEVCSNYNHLQSVIQDKLVVFETNVEGVTTLTAEIKKLNDAETPENQKHLKKLRDLLTQNEKLKGQEAAFRANCKRQLVELQAKTEQLENKQPEDEDLARVQIIEETYERDVEQLTRMKQIAAKKMRDIQMVERKMDEIPSRTELQQYQRMFVELYEQVHAKLVETRKYYSTYNTLEDTRNLLSREVSILNSVHDKYPTAMGSRQNQEKLLQSLRQILESVNANLIKVEQKLKDEKKSRDELNQKYVQLVERERMYYKAAKRFQQECLKNDILLQEVETQ